MEASRRAQTADLHWKDGRSAKESARAWIGAAPAMPDEIVAALESHGDFSTVEAWEAEPEARVRIDEFRGEPPNLDMLVRARDAHGDFVVAIEAKADETFGDSVAGTKRAAQRHWEENPASRGVARFAELTTRLLGQGPDQAMDLRYQLLTAAAAGL